MAQLKHPNIIELLGYEEKNEQKRFIIYMELAGGGELFSRVINAGTLEEDVARPFFTQLMSAVQYMHSVGCVHRDLKLVRVQRHGQPLLDLILEAAATDVRSLVAQENILLDTEDNCKVCDFGLAHVYDVDPNKQIVLTKLREICGSKSYCAPEVLEGRGYEGFPTDVWSCGICLFAMLAGFFPLDEASGSDWRFERVKLAASQGCSTAHTIFGFYDRPCNLSPDVTDLIDSMLMIDPVRRLSVEHTLQSPWVCGTGKVKGMDIDHSYSNRPVYRGLHGSGLTPEALAAMYEAEGNGSSRPVYRGGPPLGPPPPLRKQEVMFCDEFHLQDA